jgi:uncharacterized protein
MSTIPPGLREKESILHQRLDRAGRLVVAFSGGVDSSYLAYAAKQVLGEDCLAVTAISPSYPKVQREMAESIAADFEIPHRFLDAHEMDNELYRANRVDRCYHCKTELFDRIAELVEELGFQTVAYGINCDDLGDFRPGHTAAHEHQVLAPLLDAGLSKEDIRELSRAAGLPTAELPASACLASRLPYGTRVTPERLGQVEIAEDRLREIGFRQVRLRHHGDVARIEVAPDELAKALDPVMAVRMVESVKSLGFRWVALDLEGYRTGSLNPVVGNPVVGNAVVGNAVVESAAVENEAILTRIRSDASSESE